MTLEDGITEIREAMAIGSELPEVGRARQWIADLASRANLPARMSSDLQLALSEACTNAIKHSYAMQSGHVVEITVSIDDEQACLVVRDHGRKIDLQRYREPDPDEPTVGGYGIFLMRQLMDDVKFDLSRDEGNELILVKRRIAKQ